MKGEAVRRRGFWILATAGHGGNLTGRAMWNEPYLETCCRSALHRLALCGELGRPAGLKDGPCLARLADLGFARQRADGRFAITAPGGLRHAQEILKHRPPAA